MMKDSVELVLELLRGALKSRGFKEFYDGDPDLIPVSNLPCIMVSQTGDTTTRASVAENDVIDTLIIKVAYNKKDDWSSRVKATDLTEKKIRQVITGRDPQTGRYLPNTVKGALDRVKIDGDRRISRDMSLELGIMPRPNDTVTSEGHLTIQILHSVYTN